MLRPACTTTTWTQQQTLSKLTLRLPFPGRAEDETTRLKVESQIQGQLTIVVSRIFCRFPNFIGARNTILCSFQAKCPISWLLIFSKKDAALSGMASHTFSGLNCWVPPRYRTAFQDGQSGSHHLQRCLQPRTDGFYSQIPFWGYFLGLVDLSSHWVVEQLNVFRLCTVC